MRANLIMMVLDPTSAVTYAWTELQWAGVSNDRGWLSAEGYSREGTPEQP